MSAAGITLEVDGVAVDLADISWAMVAPCGCVCGLTMAWLPAPYSKEPVVTAEQAALAFSETAKERAQDKRRGFTYRPVHRSQARDLMGSSPCEHTPKWGYERPTPEGMSWALSTRWAGAANLLHLLPTEVCDGPRVEGVPLCGGKPSHNWTADRPWTMGRADCERCIAKAVAS